MGKLPPQILESLKNIIETTPADWNDLYEDHYRISQECPLRYDFPRGYRQILLQGTADGKDGRMETDYSVSLFPKEIKMLQTLVPQFYRARLAELAPGAAIDWHIDTDTSVSCRVTAMVAGQCEWAIRRRGDLSLQAMQSPEIWFNNTGWPHRVVNTAPEPRWCLLLGTNYDSIAHYF